MLLSFALSPTLSFPASVVVASGSVAAIAAAVAPFVVPPWSISSVSVPASGNVAGFDATRSVIVAVSIGNWVKSAAIRTPPSIRQR